MAQINFPEPQANGEVFDKDGVLYQYSGTPGSGFWKANSQNVVDDAYINTSGDTMSGDLTLTGLSGLGEAIVGVDANGKLMRGNGLSSFASPYILRTGDSLSGSLTLEDNLGNPHIDLNHQTGDVTLTGDLKIGSFDIDSPTVSALSRSGGGLVSGKIYAKRSDSDSNPIFEGFNTAGSMTSKINGDGSAEFSNIEFTNGSTETPFLKTGGTKLTGYASTGTVYPLTVANGSATTTFGVTDAGEVHIGGSLDTNISTPSTKLLPNGDAIFAGSATVDSLSCSNKLTIAGDLTVGVYGVTQAGIGSFSTLNCSNITATAANIGSITGEGLGLTDTLNSTAGASFGNDVSVAGSVNATGSLSGDSLTVVGSVSAGSYGSVVGTTADFTQAITADSLSLSQGLSAATASFSGQCDVGSLVSSGSLSVQSTGTFLNGVSCAGITSTDNVGISVLLSDDDAITVTQGGTVNASILGNGQASFASNNMTIGANGDVENVNNSYGAISDKKFKTNIKDAASQWSDILNIKLVNYQFKPSYGFGSDKHLGVIAQDIKDICPSLVTTKDDFQKVTTPEFDEFGLPVLDEYGNQKNTHVIQKTGTQTQSVKYSVLYLKALGALQEAMNRIETLEAKVKQLEGS